LFVVSQKVLSFSGGFVPRALHQGLCPWTPLRAPPPDLRRIHLTEILDPPLLEAEQLELKKQELARQIDRDKAEDDRRDSSVAKGKLFGDAMRASAIRIIADPIDAIPFSRNVEQLFRVYGVPSALQAILIRPFLNKKAKSILEKLKAEILGDYTGLEVALLQEFKLSANVYLERFNTCRKDTDETYVAFASRLKGLLGYYLESRRVDNFEKLCELLICDCVKSVLPEGCVRYVL